MAKRKKHHAKPAAEVKADVAETEVRPAEAETEAEIPATAVEAVNQVQPESASDAQPETAGDNLPENAESAPVSDEQPEEASEAEVAPACEAAETAEGLSTDEPTAEETAEEASPAEESATEACDEETAEEPALAEESATEEAGEPSDEEASPAEESATEACDEETAEEAALAEESATEEAGEPSDEEAAPAEESATEAGEPPAEDVWAEDRVAAPEGEPAPSEVSEQDSAVWAESSETGEAAPDGEGQPAPSGQEGDEETPAILDSTQMESIIESLLFASDRVLNLNDFKRLLDERDGKKITAAIESLSERRKGTGIEVVHLSNGWHLRTNSQHARWVSKLLAGKPMRLSRAMMETLAIVAYRQPVTRPEIDEIRGVDCGPVLKTLLDRGLVRVIGKKEDVGRPMLYGTTPEFLRVFNLRELTELPTLREYAELNSEQQAVVNAKHGPAPEGTTGPEAAGEVTTAAAPEAPAADVASAGPNLKFVPRGQLPDEPEDNDPLLDELDAATKDASKILGAANEPPPDAPAEGESPAGAEANPPAPTENNNES